MDQLVALAAEQLQSGAVYHIHAAAAPVGRAVKIGLQLVHIPGEAIVHQCVSLRQRDRLGQPLQKHHFGAVGGDGVGDIADVLRVAQQIVQLLKGALPAGLGIIPAVVVHGDQIVQLRVQLVHPGLLLHKLMQLVHVGGVAASI